MLKLLSFFILMGLGFQVFADVEQDCLIARLHAKRILETLPAVRVGKGLTIPIAVRYVREGDAAPACGLLTGHDNDVYVDIVSPEPGGNLPSCASPLRKPTYFEQTGSYIVYEYKVEDPKGFLTKTFQLYKLTVDGVVTCQNDSELTNFAVDGVEKKGVKESFKIALKKFGCNI